MSASSIPCFLAGIFLLSLSTSVFGNCSQDEHKCDTVKCINTRLQCDGKADCEDRSDELNCDMERTTANTTNSTQSPNSTTTQPMSLPTGQHSITTTRPSIPSKPIKYRFVRKRVYHDNRTRRKKRPFMKKSPVLSRNEASTVAFTRTTSAANVKTGMLCSHEECEKQKACWYGGKRSGDCTCDEAACRLGWKASADARKEKDTKLKDVFEWIVISISSAGLLLAIVVVILKRRRLRRHNNVRPLHVRTVVCYHQGNATSQLDSACVGRHVITRGHGDGGNSAEYCPLCEKTESQSDEPEKEGNVCYIAMRRQMKRDNN